MDQRVHMWTAVRCCAAKAKSSSTRNAAASNLCLCTTPSYILGTGTGDCGKILIPLVPLQRQCVRKCNVTIGTHVPPSSSARILSARCTALCLDAIWKFGLHIFAPQGTCLCLAVNVYSRFPCWLVCWNYSENSQLNGRCRWTREIQTHE